jgi:hypothetical protein
VTVVGYVRRHPVALAAIAIVIGGFLAWLAFGFFAIHLLFVDDKVDEAAPFAIEAVEPTAPSGAGTAAATTTTTVDRTSTPGTTAAPVPVVTDRGTFVSRAHPSSGTAIVITDGSQTFLRFEDFETDNGPDLFVYLVAGATADAGEGVFDDDFVDLGRLKGNIGAQNYEVPPDVDLSRYRTVVVWCRRFSTAFGAADLAPI